MRFTDIENDGFVLNEAQNKRTSHSQLQFTWKWLAEVVRGTGAAELDLRCLCWEHVWLYLTPYPSLNIMTKKKKEERKVALKFQGLGRVSCHVW